MKLFVIVLCLLSERYLIHAVSFQRFNWYNDYYSWVLEQTKNVKALSSPWLLLASVILPLLIVVGLILWIFGPILFGLVGLILHVIILYYCIGPQNPFYPVTPKTKTKQTQVGRYLAEVNEQLFAVLFWYILLGPLGAILYRTVYLSQDLKPVNKKAQVTLALLDWLPARLTVIMYLLVGNFQQGISHFSKYLLASPEKNKLLLSDCGLAALTVSKDDEISLALAENLVEHAVIIFLVFLAIITLFAWL